MNQLLAVFIGGGLGSVARFLVAKAVIGTWPGAFPWGTLTVNLLGCFLIGLIYAVAEKTTAITPELRLFLVTGFCGGFTTFSTFAYENVNLLGAGNYGYFLLYTSFSVVAGLAATFAGIVLMQRIF